ncbi:MULTISPECIES: tagatose-bisphosphate aldolase subunit GatZ [Glaesserella]|uniref:D-tagatose-1,6-bisphosphate aldolase subunit GatZ n=1 Tax=Glaesserella australis TaxID=2094024 RepID=A0A328C160_9PAST|nr:MULTISPECIES: tagatose-bisphosphate aldolase subunit GatZ [Glaesserella]AUI66929.1 tagatose-bisphosphate aldolase [Glaesserella sp. 15-184]RAL19507.1 tagatose-bisphosphate aldolase [Glaesserella australis]
MKTLVKKHKEGEAVGICSVCSAHPLVIEAALRFDLHSDKKVLIEATSNQVNQFGGYTGMTPVDFKQFVYQIAEQVGFPQDRIILGGDHLGPNCWQNEDATTAMEKAKVLVADYAKAGFTKIHLDASMSCADDPVPLPPKVVAERAAILCQAIEEVLTEEEKAQLSYIVGTEVPVPGGEAHAIQSVVVTTVESAKETIETHQVAFAQRGLDEGFKRIIGIVVQPGVEFDHSNVILYQPEQAKALSQFIESTPYIFEAHSTDYQLRDSYRALVQDHFAILKVGPALTFALREALFALANIEKELVSPEKRSYLLEVIDQVMQDEPKYWQKYYSPQHSKAMVDLHFSLSDRIRYYWPNERINHAVEKLAENLSDVSIPFGLLSQYLPEQSKRVLANEIEATPKALIIDKIQSVLSDYAYGCGN